MLGMCWLMVVFKLGQREWESCWNTDSITKSHIILIILYTSHNPVYSKYTISAEVMFYKKKKIVTVV